LGPFARFARQSQNSDADQETDKHRGVADVLADEFNHRFALRSALQARLIQRRRLPLLWPRRSFPRSPPSNIRYLGCNLV
jgi:hypothetical protein